MNIMTFADFANLIENGDYPDSLIWATVPGGIIFGKLVSHKTLDEFLEKELYERESPGDATNFIYTIDKQLDDVQQKNYQWNDRPDDKEITLVQAIIRIDGVDYHRLIANVRLSTVGAWGMDDPIENVD